jgi:ketosteroid isomerase-like protein
MKALILLVLTVAGTGCAAIRPLGTVPRSGAALHLGDVALVQRERLGAMVRQDIAALEPMLADDLVYCHSDASCEKKDEFLETIRSGRIRYVAMRVQRQTARAYGEVAILNGTLAIEGVMGGQVRTFSLVYTDVYTRRDGQWQLVAWHSTRKP